MPAKRKPDDELSGSELIKETTRRIRSARSYWDAHRNGICRFERTRALALYDKLDKEQKEQIPQDLRVWLRYRSEKYFGEHRTAPHSPRKTRKQGSQKPGDRRHPRAAKRPPRAASDEVI